MICRQVWPVSCGCAVMPQGISAFQARQLQTEIPMLQRDLASHCPDQHQCRLFFYAAACIAVRPAKPDPSLDSGSPMAAMHPEEFPEFPHPSSIPRRRFRLSGSPMLVLLSRCRQAARMRWDDSRLWTSAPERYAERPAEPQAMQMAASKPARNTFRRQRASFLHPRLLPSLRALSGKPIQITSTPVSSISARRS